VIFGFFGKGGDSEVELQKGNEIELDIVGASPREVYITEALESSKEGIDLIIPHKGTELVLNFQPGVMVMGRYELEGKVARFKTTVARIDERSSPPLLVLAQPKKLEWSEKTAEDDQRRNFVRLQEALTISFSPMRGVFREGTTMNISGNGLSMVVDFEMDVGKRIPFTIPLPQKKVTCMGKIVRCQPYGKQTARPKFEVGVSFEEIDASNQDAIVRHIFERQRELRRRGLM